MNAFRTLLVKELRELLTPLVLVPLLLVVVIFFGIGRITQGESKRAAAEPTTIDLIDRDGSSVSQSIGAILSSTGATVHQLSAATSVADGLAAARADHAVGLIDLPAGFGAHVSAGQRAGYDRYAVVSTLSISSLMSRGTLETFTAGIDRDLSARLVKSHSALDPALVAQPLAPTDHVAIGDKVAQIDLASVLTQVQTQTFAIPLILFIVIIFGAQLVITTMASEKENKTLETLLAAPISRAAIVAAKLVAAGILGLVFSVVYMIGFRQYMAGLSGGALFANRPELASALHSLGITFTPTNYALLGVSLFVAILAGLALALILGVFVTDMKSVQATLAPLMMVVLLPYLIVNFVDLSRASTGLKYLTYAIPFTHALLAPQLLILGQTRLVLYGILYQIVFVIILIAIASRLFSTDAILTLKLKKLRLFGR